MAKDELVVGYESALDYWRAVRVAGFTDDEGEVYGARALEIGKRAQGIARACNSDLPLHVVVASAGERHNSPNILDHVWRGPLPDYLKHHVGNGAVVCGAAATFVQLGCSLDYVELAQLACELLGTYGLTPWAQDSYETHLEPLVSIDELVAYAQSAHAMGVRGAANALEALKVAAPGSASPRESDIAVIMGLTRKRGGFDLGGFEMNAEIKLKGKAAEIFGRPKIRPDFSWPGTRTVLEYNSDERHANKLALGRDSRRVEALKAAGYSVHVLTNDQVRDYDHLVLVMGEIAKELGRRRKPLSVASELRCYELHRRLF